MYRYLFKLYFNLYFYLGYKKIKEADAIYQVETLIKKWIFNQFTVRINNEYNHVSIILLKGDNSIIINMFKDSTKTVIKVNNSSLLVYGDVICAFSEYCKKNNFVDIINKLDG